MFFIEVGYPSEAEELMVAKRTTGEKTPELESVISAEEIMRFQKLVRRIPVPDHIYNYVVKLVRHTRPGEGAFDWVNSLINWGAGPRAVQYLILGAKTHAALNGNYMVSMEDVNAVTQQVLVHRIQLTFQAESEGISPAEVVTRLVKEVSGEE